MKFKKLNPSQYLLCLDTNEKLAETLLKFLEDEKIESGFITGLGSFHEAVIGFYDTVADGYNWKTLTGVYEILSLTGNCARVDGKAVFHLHLVAGDAAFNALGGHLKDLTVGATCELMLHTSNVPVTRKQSPYKELKTLDL